MYILLFCQQGSTNLFVYLTNKKQKVSVHLTNMIIVK